jgi:hypothetical protein
MIWFVIVFIIVAGLTIWAFFDLDKDVKETVPVLVILCILGLGLSLIINSITGQLIETKKVLVNEYDLYPATYVNNDSTDNFYLLIMGSLDSEINYYYHVKELGFLVPKILPNDRNISIQESDIQWGKLKYYEDEPVNSNYWLYGFDMSDGRYFVFEVPMGTVHHDSSIEKLKRVEGIEKE